MSSSLQQLADKLTAEKLSHNASLPPVEKWNPPLSGKMDLCIARDGTWYHEGTAFQRQALVKLFASILKREGDDYFLVTPVEKWQIDVEDAPLLVTGCEILEAQGQQAIVLTTYTEDNVLLSENNPLRVTINPETGEPSPYVLVRRNLEAKINRAVYYQLVEIAQESIIDGESCYTVESMGQGFMVG